jgi:hypothetical protein
LVQNYKNDIGLKKRCRPARFIISLKQVIYAKIIEIEFPGCRTKQQHQARYRPKVERGKMDERFKKEENRILPYNSK